METTETTLKQLELEMKHLKLKEKKLDMRKTLRLKELAIEVIRAGGREQTLGSDFGKDIRMVPPFREAEIDRYFSHFERVTTTLKWSKDVWTLISQCVLVEKRTRGVFVTVTRAEF